LTFEQIAGWVVGAQWNGGVPAASATVGDISTDSRSVIPGEVFVALGPGASGDATREGSSFDGHDFVEKAFALGASAAIVERRWGTAAAASGWGEHRPLLLVDDTLKALGDLAANYRQQFDIPVIAVVGSAGKTTTKEMIAAVLSRRFNVLKSEGTENNEIGVPKALLRLTAEHEVAVVEMAARKTGDIRYL